MADLNQKYPENADGKFYVDSQCIGCVSCVTVAPGHFQMTDGNRHSSVSRQPRTPEELELCRQALEICPVNAIGADGAPCFKLELLSSLERFGPRPALVQASSGLGLSYAELGSWMDQVAALLRSHEVAPGEVVALSSENSLELVALLYGCMAYGAVAMPLNPKLAAPEMRTLLAHSGARLLLSDRSLDLSGAGTPLLPIAAFKAFPALSRASWTETQVLPESGALLIYTSGTTGAPKGVMLSHANLAFNARYAAQALGMDEEHDTLCLLPLFHTFGFISDLSTSFLSGSRTVILEAFDLSRLAQVEAALATYGARSFSAVPLIFELLLRFNCRLLGSGLRFCVSGAAPLRPDTAAAFQQRYCLPILPAYGLTETTCFCTLSRPGEVEEGTVGLPAGLELRVVGEDGQDLEPGATGEILVKGPSVIQGGYYKDSRQAYAAPGWFRTGDLGRLNPSGRLSVTGRRKNMIIRGGEKVFLEDIDRCLKEMPGVQDCASVRLDGRDVEKFACFIQAQGAPLDEPAVFAWLRARVGAAKCPDFVYLIDNIPRSSTHKVNLAALQGRALEKA